jgi:predicted acetyltransferase
MLGMTRLLRPDPGRYEEWAAMVREFAGAYPHGSGLPADRPVGDRGDFAASIAKAARMADTSLLPPEGLVHDDLYWIADADGHLVGFLSLRHELNDFLREQGGHVGYSVRPSRRREGHAARALGLAVERAGELGLGRVLVTCEEDNLASARTIESQGGAMEDVRHGKRRYWIVL